VLVNVQLVLPRSAARASSAPSSARLTPRKRASGVVQRDFTGIGDRTHAEDNIALDGDK
jgi:hypothetical protein